MEVKSKFAVKIISNENGFFKTFNQTFSTLMNQKMK